MEHFVLTSKMTPQFWLGAPYFNGNMFDLNRWKLEIFWPVRFDYQTVFIKSSGHQSMCLLVYMSNLTDLTSPLFDLRSHTMKACQQVVWQPCQLQ